MDSLKVTLAPDADKALRSYVYDLFQNEISRARRDAGLDHDFVNKKTAISYSGISYQKFSELVDKGLIKAHNLDGTLLYSKKELEQLILSH